jgi:hypothetical protein
MVSVYFAPSELCSNLLVCEDFVDITSLWDSTRELTLREKSSFAKSQSIALDGCMVGFATG